MGRTDLEAASVMARGVIAVLTLERDEARAQRDALRERAETAEAEVAHWRAFVASLAPPPGRGAARPVGDT